MGRQSVNERFVDKTSATEVKTGFKFAWPQRPKMRTRFAIGSVELCATPRRYLERVPVILTSNRSLGEWCSTRQTWSLGNPRQRVFDR